MFINFHEKSTEELVRVLQNNYGELYEPKYARYCFEALESRADSFPEAYYHLGRYCQNHGDDGVPYFDKGAKLNDFGCMIESYIYSIDTDSVEDDEEYMRIMRYCVDNSVSEALWEKSRAIEDTDPEMSIKYMCESYDALYPEFKYQNLKANELTLERYISNKELFAKYASKHQLSILSVAETFKNMEKPSPDVPNDIIFETYHFTKNWDIMLYLMLERYYEDAFKYAYEHELVNFWEEDDSTVQKLLAVGKKHNIACLLPYVAKYTDDVEDMAMDGNIYAMADLFTDIDSIKEYDSDVLYEYVKSLAMTGLRCFSSSIRNAVNELNTRKYKIDNYLIDIYGQPD